MNKPVSITLSASIAQMRVSNPGEEQEDDLVWVYIDLIEQKQ